MQCPNCGKEMKKGFLFSSKDGAFSFAERVPGVFESANTAQGFVRITPLRAGQRTRAEAFLCEACRIAEITY